jgi:hypothetical protein
VTQQPDSLFDIDPESYLNKCRNRKLEDKVTSLMRSMEEFQHDIGVNARTDKYFYLQKLTEVTLWEEQLHVAIDRVKFIVNAIKSTNENIFNHWRADLKVLKRANVKGLVDEEFQKESSDVNR